MANIDKGFGKSNKQLATMFNISVSDVKRIKKLVEKDITKQPNIKKVTKELRGKAAIDAYQKSISPRGMAKTKAKQTAALDKLMKKRYGNKK